MADDGQNVAVIAENVNENNISSTNNTPQTDEPPAQVNGWLMKRSRRTHKWKKRWFQLNNTELAYGRSEEVSFAATRPSLPIDK